MKMPRFLTVTKRVFMDLKNDKRSASSSSPHIG